MKISEAPDGHLIIDVDRSSYKIRDENGVEIPKAQIKPPKKATLLRDWYLATEKAATSKLGISLLGFVVLFSFIGEYRHSPEIIYYTSRLAGFELALFALAGFESARRSRFVSNRRK